MPAAAAAILKPSGAMGSGTIASNGVRGWASSIVMGLPLKRYPLSCRRALSASAAVISTKAKPFRTTFTERTRPTTLNRFSTAAVFVLSGRFPIRSFFVGCGWHLHTYADVRIIMH